MSKKIFTDTVSVADSIAAHNNGPETHEDIRQALAAQSNQINNLSTNLGGLSTLKTASKASAVAAINENVDKIDDLAGSKFLTGVDFNDFKTKGKRSFNATCLNKPPGITDGYIEFTPYGTYGSYAQQEVLGFTTAGVQKKYIRLLNNNVWTVWKEIATTEIINLSTITFLNGFERFADTSYGGISRSGNVVTVNLLLSGNKGTVGSIICMLPFLPKFNEIHMYENVQYRVSSNGALTFHLGVIPTSSYFSVNLTYTCV